ncbi:MAG: hypothetical protein OEW75_18160 [Cyclobacteriaceae bacterium]|nr:hypothetical protein [Cyclobacteriaceae bacterium]
MEYLAIIIAAVLGFQLYLFFYGKKEKKKGVVKSSAVLDKYNIKNRGQLFNLINSSGIPEEDRLVLEDHYQKGI